MTNKTFYFSPALLNGSGVPSTLRTPSNRTESKDSYRIFSNLIRTLFTVTEG